VSPGDQDRNAGRVRRFSVIVTVDAKGRVHVPVPLDPDDAWGPKPRHHVTGTLAGCGLRAVIESTDGGHEIVLGPAWHRAGRADTDAPVEVVLTPEGPQRDDLAPDIAAALDAAPDAAAFFDSLAQFYRRAYLRWIDATKRHPEQRPLRIAEVIGLLRDGKKERPRPGGDVAAGPSE
jgi:Bacteriocin-protection, YdeI or OmpD-Associated